MDIHEKLKLAESMLEASKEMPDNAIEFLDSSTQLILENKTELEKYVIDKWSLMGLWFSLRLMAVKKKKKRKRSGEFAHELVVHKKHDSDLSNLEFRETLARISAQCIIWKDPTEFEVRLRSLEYRADPTDPDVADTFAALEIEVRVAKDIRKGFVKKVESTPKEFLEWLEERKKLMKQIINEKVEKLTLRPGERERQMRSNMGIEVGSPKIVMETSRSPNAIAFAGEDPFKDSVTKDVSYLILFDGLCRARGFDWWENSVLLSRDYFEKKKQILKDKPILVKYMGRYDIIHEGVLWETEDSRSAIYKWLNLTKEPTVKGMY